MQLLLIRIFRCLFWVLVTVAMFVITLCATLQPEQGAAARGAPSRCAFGCRSAVRPLLRVPRGRRLQLATPSSHPRRPRPPAVTDRARARLARCRSSSSASA